MFDVMPVNSVFHGVSWFHVAGQCIPIAPCVCYLERSIIPVTTKSNQTKRKEKKNKKWETDCLQRIPVF